MRVSGIPYIQGRNSYTDRDGTKYGIAIHNTSNDASDENEASYAKRRTDGVSSHFYCDRDSVTQSLDTAARAGHAGSSNGNEHAVAVEITGANGWSRQTWLANVAWDKLGAVLAQVCRHYGIAVRRASVAEMKANPKVKAFYSHDDMRRAWGGTDHTDPGGNFPWDRLFAAVNAALGTAPPAATTGDDMDSNQAQQLTNVHDWIFNYLNGRVTGTWPHSTGALPKLVPNETLARIDSALAVSAQREQDMLTALKALAQGGTSIDTAAVMARIDQRSADVTGLLQQQATRIAELESELAATRAAAEANLSPAERATLPAS